MVSSQSCKYIILLIYTNVPWPVSFIKYILWVIIYPQGLYMPWSSDWCPDVKRRLNTQSNHWHESSQTECSIKSLTREWGFINMRMGTSLVVKMFKTKLCFLVLSNRWHQRFVETACTTANLVKSTVTAYVMLQSSSFACGASKQWQSCSWDSGQTSTLLPKHFCIVTALVLAASNTCILTMPLQVAGHCV